MSKNKYRRLVNLELRRRHLETTDVINYEILDIRNKTRHYADSEDKPSDSKAENYWIRVDMDTKDAAIREAENSWLY